LVDLNLVDLIARSAELEPRDVVLEIGAGGGSLTTRLSAAAGWVVAAEIDPPLAALARRELSQRSNVTLLELDALQNKHTFHPQLLAELRARLAEVPGAQLKLVANLPYNIATPVMANLLDFEPAPVRMVATIQKELADRIAARPQTRDYSALSIWIQAQADVEILRQLPPTVFWPQPRVHSAIIQIKPDPQRRKALGDPEFFHRAVRGIYLHRRKLLRSALLATFGQHLDKRAIDRILQAQAIDPQRRAEQLDVPQTVALLSAFRQAITGD